MEELSPFAGQQLNADAVVVDPPLPVLAAVVVVVPDCVTVALGLSPDAITLDWANDDDDWGTVIVAGLPPAGEITDTQAQHASPHLSHTDCPNLIHL